MSRNRYNKLFAQLSDAGVEYIVAGGVAAVIQGVERVTLDLDISLNFSRESCEAFIGIMKEQGLTPMVPVDPFVIAEERERQAMIDEKNAIVFTFRNVDDPFWHIDVFLLEELSYDKLKPSCDVIDLDGRDVYVLSKQKLIELKRAIDPPRPKDQMDIAELTRLLEDESK